MVSRKSHWDIFVSFYLILCGISSIRYLLVDVSLIDGEVPLLTQVLCFGATLACIVYFFRPIIGFIGLTVLTILTIGLAGMANDTKAICYHVIILLILGYMILDWRRNHQPG